MKFRNIDKRYDFVVVGGGFAGITAAIMAAREGLKVALISNRGFIGGNSGAEIRCPVDGADGEQQFNFNARETGLIEEIRLENLFVNPEGNSYRWDAVLMDFISREKTLELFLNLTIDEVEMDGDRISWIAGSQSTTEKHFTFHSELFCDNTGDGTLSYLSGCRYRIGSEASIEYGEKIAPKEADAENVLLSTLTYYAKDLGHPVAFCRPDNSFDMEKSGILKHREIPKEMFHRFVWFYEAGGQMDQVADSEKINMEHRKLVYSIWDYVKKHDYGAEQYDFEFISPYPGKRESRRIKGAYTLTEKDVVFQHEFSDSVGYGGWAIDLHSKLGFYGCDCENWWVYLKGVFSIPLRCAIAEDVSNLFIIGRCFSVSRIALGATRLNATLATVGQAVGLAAAICRKYSSNPLSVVKNHMNELHCRQFRCDQTVIGYRNRDVDDKALRASITASSEMGYELPTCSEWYRLDSVVAISMPIRKEAKSIRFQYRSSEETVLALRIFRSSKPENYNPDVLMKEYSFHVSATDCSFVECDLPKLSVDCFLFIELEGTPSIELAVTTDRLPCVVALMRRENRLPNVRDYDSLEMMPYEWMKLGTPLKLRKYSTASMKNITYTPCFTIEPAITMYGAENINNGYLRPYSMPNLWVSAGASDETVDIAFDSIVEVSEIDITFNSDLNFRLRNVKPYDFNVMPEIVRDYDILLLSSEGAWKTVRQIRGNHQRFNVICLDNREKTTCVRLKFIGTNGAKFVSIYNVSIY